MHIDYNTRQALIDTLVPHMQVMAERRALVDSAFYGTNFPHAHHL